MKPILRPLTTVLSRRPTSSFLQCLRSFSAGDDSSIQSLSHSGSVRIGHVQVPLGDPKRSDASQIPRGYLPSRPSPTMLQHLQWMMAKDSIGQDSMLIGPPGAGSIYRRRLALAYAELTQRPVEMLTLSTDTTESDLKQRRELVSSSSASPNGGTSVEFIPQAPVRAALNGRLLILDGLEEVQRNVLPTLNNLLEHREMHLDDGTFLVSPRRYQQLDKSSSFLLPVHKDFRVLALAVPAPPYPGRSLDPPLRSRFQIRRVDNPTSGELYERLMQKSTMEGEADYNRNRMVELLSTVSGSMEESCGYSIPPFPTNHLESMLEQFSIFPNQNKVTVFQRAYPLGLKDERFEEISRNSHTESQSLLRTALSQVDHKELFGRDNDSLSYLPTKIRKENPKDREALVTFSAKSKSFFGNDERIFITVPCGANEVDQSFPSFVTTSDSRQILASMMQEHSVGNDMLLMSPKGEGKSATIRQFASLLGYDTHLFAMYKEMTSRDLLLRRSTDPLSGETTWEDGILLIAAKQGDICVLDGIEKLQPDVLSSLQSLVSDRELVLPNGHRLVRSHQTADKTTIVHPSFRIIALASLSEDTGTSFLTADTMSMFTTLLLSPPTSECLSAILQTSNNKCPEEVVQKVLELGTALSSDIADECGVSKLSTRNMIRIIQRTAALNELHDIVCSVLVADLLPPSQRASLESLLSNIGITKQGESKKGKSSTGEILVKDDEFFIGDFTMKRNSSSRPEMVPSPHFFDVKSHVEAIQDLLQDWSNGERAFLMLGNQGVGKNMIIDRICQIANWEREYIQLHRDMSISAMTLAPSLEDGRIVWRDSPLIRAARDGCALVIDEADKAPIEVVSVLKGLIEDGELLLADGRRLSRHRKGTGIIEIHPDFTLWVLANRPGFPFLGNDFFGEVGDVFRTAVIPNPDFQSELNLLQSYAPAVDEKLLRSIAGSFSDLRHLSDIGDLAYPYSTREAVAVAKHLQKYPQDNVVAVLHNVLDFDSFYEQTYGTLGQVFQRHGLEVTSYPAWVKAMKAGAVDAKGDYSSLEIEYLNGRGEAGTSNNPPDLGSPKRGKWDDRNDPHVGGNQWAGGTGGSDTAGLGGRGGPYRLDRGHKVHQVSEEAKAEVDEASRKVAREIAKKALDDKLREIGMSQQEWNMYERFARSIKKDVSTLRSLLQSVSTKSTEKGWIKRQSHGEIDDSRLIDGVTGDKYIYKRRGSMEDAPSSKPKRLRFVMDISGSMYRFNSYDERLIRCLEAALLIMESFDGFEQRFDYSIVGHSGDSSLIPLVDFGNPPKNERERMRILQTMLAHSQYCQSGDNTLEAIGRSIQDVSKNEDSDDDDAIVIGVSDANLARYGIDPRQLGRIIEAGEKRSVKAYCVFIASFGEEADEIKRSLPIGRGQVCLDTSELPKVVRNILASRVR
jgi:von Willebrand factor A domain-containing protein 8